MCAGEVLQCRVGSVDLAGGYVWVRDGLKTSNRRRSVALPAELRTDLAELAAGFGPDELLLRARSSRHGRLQWVPHKNTWINDRIASVCAEAGVAVVTSHGLRGTYTSILNAVGGLRAPEIAKLVGHGDAGQTAAAHYIRSPDRRAALDLVAGVPRLIGNGDESEHLRSGIWDSNPVDPPAVAVTVPQDATDRRRHGAPKLVQPALVVNPAEVAR